MRIRVVAAAGAVALTGVAAAFVAPAANATVTNVGNCRGQLVLNKFTPHLSDQTVVGTKIVGALLKDEDTLAVKGGVCTAVARPGDTHIPQPSGTLHPKAVGIAMLGNGSCAENATAVAADANKARAWSFNGTITWTMTETYVDLITGKTHPYLIKAQSAVLGFNTGAYAPDSIDVGGIVSVGLVPGATVSGTVWEDPVTKNDSDNTDIYNVGYELDVNNALACADGTPNNANVAQVERGGGGATSTSLIGTTSVPGVSLSLGE
jgi:hypothetical protein